MKYSFTFIILASIFFISSDISSPINYTHKSVQKAIKTQFKQKHTKLIEHNFVDSLFLLTTGKYFNIKAKELTKAIGYTYIGRVACCRAGGCSNPTYGNSSSPQEQTEFLDYFILFDTTFVIKHVGVFNYQATHGYGVTAKSWLKQFNNLSPIAENINNFKVDAISGATVSVNAITEDIIFHTKNISKAF